MLGLSVVLLYVMVGIVSTPVPVSGPPNSHQSSTPVPGLAKTLLKQLWGHCWEELAVTSLTWGRKVFKSGPYSFLSVCQSCSENPPMSCEHWSPLQLLYLSHPAVGVAVG